MAAARVAGYHPLAVARVRVVGAVTVAVAVPAVAAAVAATRAGG